MKYHFDLKGIAADPEGYRQALAARGYRVNIDSILDGISQRSEILQHLEKTRNNIKTSSQEIGQAIKSGDLQQAEEIKKLVVIFKDNEQELSDRLARVESNLTDLLLNCPNVLDPRVPQGVDERDNLEIKVVGKTFARDLPHYDLPLDWGFDIAAKISGTRFSSLSGGLARLHRAIGQFMLDQQIDRGYKEVIPPVIVNQDALFHTGQLPKFRSDLFETLDSRFLIPTSEVSLTNIFANQILEDTHRVVALTDCFRREAGSAGRDTRGIIRQHQFQKVELVTLTDPQNSDSEHEFMLESAEMILKKLDLPYRVVLLCSGDMGFSARKTYDIEVWLAGEKTYREISSVSNTGDFQSRRMNTRYKIDGKSVYAHSLNGSGLAVGRTLAAIVEAYQQDSDIMIPEALRPYCREKIFLSELDKSL